MNEIDYISEINYWLKQLRDKIKIVKFDIEMTKKVIINRSNNLILYTRDLKDNLENG